MEASLVGPQGRIALGPAKLTVGRSADNNLVVNDNKVSSHHAEIHPEGQYYSIVDLGSTNKTFVNEQVLYSGVPRLLQQGDALRFGDTTYTYEVGAASYQNNAPAPQGPTVMASSGEAFPNYGASNTSYGGGGTVYSGGNQEEYMETLRSQQPAQPPQQSYMAPPPSYTPSPSSPSYMMPDQQSSYGAPTQPYGGMDQQPSYMPTQYAQSSQMPQAPLPPPQYVPPPQPEKKRSPLLAIILVVLALVIIAGGIGTFLVINNNNIATDHANATATAKANANAQATTHAQATAHAIVQATAQANATATAQATSNFPPFTKVALNDSLTSSSTSQWSTASHCQFLTAGYQISVAQAGTFSWCSAASSNTFSDFAYQVNMTINSGDCGGLLFRYADSNNFYIFEVCQYGTYNVGVFVNNAPIYAYKGTFPSNAAIHKGVNQSNIIAVTVQGNTINLYANQTKIDTVTDSNISQGLISLIAVDGTNPTAVTYSNALVWVQPS